MSNTSYGTGYDGRLSNSAISSALTCSHQHKVMYIDNKKGDVPLLRNHATAGIVVHDLIDEFYDDEKIQLGAILKAITPYLPDPLDYLRHAMECIEPIKATITYGLKYGNVYKKPTWTNHFKKNNPELVKELTRLDEATSHKHPLDTHTKTEWISEVVRYLTNFRKLRGEIDALGWTCHSREGLMLFNSATAIPMAGRYDALFSCGDDLILVDFKTGGQGWTPEKIACHDQLYVYVVALSQAGKKVTQIAIGDLSDGKIVMADPATFSANIALAWDRFDRNAAFTRTATHVAAGRNDFTCGRCPVPHLKGGCKWLGGTN